MGSVRGLVVSWTCCSGFWAVDWTVLVAVSVTLLAGRPLSRPLVMGSRDIAVVRGMTENWHEVGGIFESSWRKNQRFLS